METNSIDKMGIVRFIREVENCPIDTARELFDWSREEGKHPWVPVVDVGDVVVDFYAPDMAEAADMRSWLNQYKLAWAESIKAYRVVYD